jgi:hypothetical protein
MNNSFVKEAAAGYAIYTFAGQLVLSIIMMVIGYFLRRHAKKFDSWIKTNATVIDPTCNKQTDISKEGTKISYNCSSKIKYSLDGSTVEVTDDESNDYSSGETLITTINENVKNPYYKGQLLEIIYNPLVPLDMNVGSYDMVKLFSNGLLIIGLILLLVSVFGLQYCIRNKCTTLGAIFGFSSAVGAVGNIGGSGSNYGYGTYI